jgi:type II secretory pathway pseudopilin PulG
MKQRIQHRRGVTLVELMVICAILGVLMGMVMFALQGANEQARADRTRAEIIKINDLIMQRWDGYRSRPIPYRPAATATLNVRAATRLEVTWELMRMELPERISDVSDTSKFGIQPALWRAYRAKLVALTGADAANPTSKWSKSYSNSECLYLILSSIRDGDSNGLDSFTPREIGDLDGDKVPEILDGWGRPIGFYRWAPGFTAANKMPTSLQTGDAAKQYDPLDPYQLHSGLNTHFALFPLIYSAGPDGRIENDSDGKPYVWGYGLQDPAVSYGGATSKDPWYTVTTSPAVGAPMKEGGYETWLDNITNHLQVVR